MYQDGRARHAGGPDLSCEATIASGRWVAAISAAFAGDWSAANTSRKALRSMYWSTPPGNGRSKVVDGPRSEPGNRVKMSIWGAPSSDAMAATDTSACTLGAPTPARREARAAPHRLHAGSPARPVRYHHAAVRVPAENDGRRDGREHTLEV